MSKKGIRIVNAKNGAEAVEMVQNDNEISLVLMDIKMPVMNGEEAIRQIRTLIKTFLLLRKQPMQCPPTEINF
ncbi:MAG: response regulator [Draconibacterium sp.]